MNLDGQKQTSVIDKGPNNQEWNQTTEIGCAGM